MYGVGTLGGTSGYIKRADNQVPRQIDTSGKLHSSSGKYRVAVYDYTNTIYLRNYNFITDACFV